jgi:hypothetical protein
MSEEEYEKQIEDGFQVSEPVYMFKFRWTNLVVRCPHCRKTFRLGIGLLGKKEKNKGGNNG